MTNLFIILGTFAWIFCPTILFGGFMVFAILFILRASQGKQTKAWEELGLQTGLVLTPGSFTRRPRLDGSFRGRDTKIYTIMRGAGRNRTSYTVIAMAVDNPMGNYLSISGEGLLSGIAKSFGMQDVKIDDQEFDSRFVIKSQPESFAREVFREGSLRRHLLQARYLNITLKEGQIIYEKRNIETDVSHLLFLLDLMNHLAEACKRITEGSDFPP